MSYSVKSGDKDGVKGTFYTEEVRGGPGMYPYKKIHFVADSDKGAVDTRGGANRERPWEMYRHTTETAG